MAVTQIGLSDVADDASSEATLRIGPGWAPGALYVKFHTDFVQGASFFDLAVSWRAVARGDVPGGSGYGDWEPSGAEGALAGDRAWYYRRFGVSDDGVWHSGQDELGPGAWWSVPLGFASQDASTPGSASAEGRLCGGDWSFAARRFDAINLCVKVRFAYSSGGSDAFAPLAMRDDIYVGYIPQYVASSARVTAEGLAIRYSSPGWERSSDRWSADGGISAGGEAVVPSKVYGTLSSAGELVVPASELAFDPRGRPLSGTVRFNACWRPIDMPFATMPLDGISVPDDRAANTPTVEAEPSADGLGAVVRVGDSGDLGVPLASVAVRLVGGQYQFDRAEVGPGGSAEFRFAPLGVETEWEAVGASESGALSAPARARLAPLADRAWGASVIEPTDGSEPAVAVLGRERSTRYYPDVELVRLQGRSRPTALVGPCAEVGVVERFVVVPDGGPRALERAAASVGACALCGTAVQRSPGGARRLLAVTSATVEEMSRHLEVTMEMSEVSP